MMSTKLGILEHQKYTASNLAYHTIFFLHNYYTMYVLIKYAGSNSFRNISEELRPDFDQD